MAWQLLIKDFFPVISTFVRWNCDKQISLRFQTKAYVNESCFDLSKYTQALENNFKNAEIKRFAQVSCVNFESGL